MAEQHLHDLDAALEQRGWRIEQDAGPAGSYRWGISGTWVIARGAARLHVDFEGADADGVDTYPLERAYACHVRESPATKLYFGRRSRASSWRADLRSFVHSIDDLRA